MMGIGVVVRMVEVGMVVGMVEGMMAVVVVKGMGMGTEVVRMVRMVGVGMRKEVYA
jgi:hypothetical protein